MDIEKQQAPRFEEYPEIYKLQNGKDWTELSLDEINTVLRAYGKFLAIEILKTNCTVNNWNLGNEANFGFAGVSFGLKTAVNKKLEGVTDFMRYIYPVFNIGWLEDNIWKYNAKEFAAVKEGILEAYKDLGIDSKNVKFSTHIATVVMTPSACARYFKCLLSRSPHDVSCHIVNGQANQYRMNILNFMKDMIIIKLNNIKFFPLKESSIWLFHLIYSLSY